ncbi:hypothetical protein ACJH6J_18295 [Mycobacterium sp. SMC-18]|uniref:hypothetical protein n=1 Tax=Mycobacterium sp. SMC-18 TaxID=3381629 RepID=UPI0038766420
MNPKKTKIIDGIEYEVVDMPPVELDPPAPEVVRWQELADRELVIYHGGDAEKILSFPRPAWSDPDCDGIGNSVLNTRYRSAITYVVSGYGRGDVDDDELEPAAFGVRVAKFGDGTEVVNVHLRRQVDGKWVDFGLSMFLEQARELARVIDAAADLVEVDR